MNAWEKLEAIHQATSENDINPYQLVNLLHFTEHDSHGKMANMTSISTSCRANAFCMECSQIKGSSCEGCYARNEFNRHNNDQCAINNSLILHNHLIPVEAFKCLWFNHRYLRIEAMGEVQNLTHARNYVRLAAALESSGVTCAIWSKRPDIYGKAFELDGKPNNLIYVHSSLMLNETDVESLDKYPFIDKVFTVFTKPFAKSNEIRINCEQRCKDCMKCYTKSSEIQFINEIKK